MSSTSFFFRRAAILTITSLAALIAGKSCWGAVSFELPQVQVAPAPSGPTTGSFSVIVHATGTDIGRSLSSLNVDFSVANLLVKLGPPSIPSVNPLLSDPGSPGDPTFFSNSTDQNIRWAHDVRIGFDQPLVDGKSLVSVPFSVPAGLTGTFQLAFGPGQNNTLVASNGSAIAPNLTDVGQITVMAASAGVPGDYNNNGIVDAADYVVWRNTLNTSTALPNEVPGVSPGTVTQDDYNAWRARFGNTSGSGAAALVASAVPEPASLFLLLIVSFVPACARCQRREA